MLLVWYNACGSINEGADDCASPVASPMAAAPNMDYCNQLVAAKQFREHVSALNRCSVEERAFTDN